MTITSPVWDSPERAELRSTVRGFVERHVRPHQDDWERDGLLPRDLHREAAKLGLFGLGIDEEVGGSGGDLVDASVLGEEFHYAGAAAGVFASLFTHGIALPHLIAAGDPDQIDRWVRPTLAGEKIGSLAITEPDGGSDVGHLRTTAVRDGDHFVVNGAKTYITSAVRADFVTTAVRTGGPGASGVSLLVLEKDTPGFTVTRRLDKMGWRSSDTAELAFVDAMDPSKRFYFPQTNGGLFYFGRDVNIRSEPCGNQPESGERVDGVRRLKFPRRLQARC